MNQPDQRTTEAGTPVASDAAASTTLTDLKPTETEIEGIKGRPGGWGSGTCGYSNHNETTTEDDETEALLDDLAVEDDEQVKGGGGGGWGCQTCGYTNHNETLAEDEATSATELLCADLDLSAAQSGQVQGGVSRPVDTNNHGTHVAGTIGAMGSGGIATQFQSSNHNETTVEDDEAGTEVLDDLPVENDEQIAGGMLKRIRIGGMS